MKSGRSTTWWCAASISVLYPACEYEETSLTAQAADETFAARGKRILSSGWKAVYEDGPAWEDSDSDSQDDPQVFPGSQNLPQLKNQDRLPINRVNPDFRQDKTTGQIYGGHPSVRHGKPGQIHGIQ